MLLKALFAPMAWYDRQREPKRMLVFLLPLTIFLVAGALYQQADLVISVVLFLLVYRWIYLKHYKWSK